MIASLRGTLLRKTPTEVVIDVQGIGYAVHIPLSTFERIGDEGTSVTLLTHQHVREDSIQLFGFISEQEREIFRLLISINGIGPRMAQGILSGVSVNDLRQHILAGNTGALTAIPGVGRKIADRLVLELREKITKFESHQDSSLPSSSSQSRIRSEALLALTSLGYSRPAAEKALRQALQDAGMLELPVEELIKAALRHAGGQ